MVMENQAKQKSASPARKGYSQKSREGRMDSEFKQEIVDLARVTRVMAGGKRMRFRACVAKARKNMVTVPFVNETIPYAVTEKFGSAIILLKPAPKGTGVKAGGPLRMVFELAGVRNIVGKILGSKNKINNVTAALQAIKSLRLIEVKPREEKNIKQVK